MISDNIDNFNMVMGAAGCDMTYIRNEGNYIILHVGNVNVEELKIPQGVTHIENTIQANNTILKSLVIPESVVEIGDNSFEQYLRLEVILGAVNVEKIGSAAFAGCCTVDILAFPKATDIGDRAFEGCEFIEAISLPSVKFIGYQAFQGCTRMHDFQGAPVVVKNAAFRGAGSLSKINKLDLTRVAEIGDRVFDSSKIGTIQLDRIEYVSWDCFSGCQGEVRFNFIEVLEVRTSRIKVTYVPNVDCTIKIKVYLSGPAEYYEEEIKLSKGTQYNNDSFTQHAIQNRDSRKQYKLYTV